MACCTNGVRSRITMDKMAFEKVNRFLRNISISLIKRYAKIYAYAMAGFNIIVVNLTISVTNAKHIETIMSNRLMCFARRSFLGCKKSLINADCQY